MGQTGLQRCCEQAALAASIGEPKWACVGPTGGPRSHFNRGAPAVQAPHSGGMSCSSSSTAVSEVMSSNTTDTPYGGLRDRR